MTESKDAIPKLYVMVGIPASGKSTWIERNLPASILRIRLEQIRRRVYGHYPLRLDQSNENETWSKAERVLAEAVQSGRAVVVDSMALTREWRQRIVAVASRAVNGSIERIAVFLDTPLEIALARNRRREKRVFEEVIWEMAGHLQTPSPEEEFDQVLLVRPPDDAAWGVG